MNVAARKAKKKRDFSVIGVFVGINDRTFADNLFMIP